MLLRIDIVDAAKRGGIATRSFGPGQPDGLIATQAGTEIDGTMGAQAELDIALGTRDEVGAGLTAKLSVRYRSRAMLMRTRPKSAKMRQARCSLA